MDINEIINLVKQDPSLSFENKQELTNEESQKKLKSFLSGVAGASLMLALAKYKKLSKPAKIALALVGFGAGKLVYSYYKRDKFSNYDDKTDTYKIDTNRF